MSEEVIVVEWAEPGVSEEGCQVQIITDNPSAVFSDSLVQNILVNTVVQGQEEDHQLLDDNDCEECHASDKDQCDVQGGLSFMLDSPTPMGIPQRALLTLPHGLVVGRSSIPGAGLGVLNQGPTVAPGMHFGPCEGEVTTRERAVASDYSWEVWNSKSESEYIDAARDTHSNWMRYVNCARNEEEGNLIALQYRGIVFFHCCRSILPGDEFLFWPGGRFIERFRDPSDQIWLRKCTPSEFRTDLSSQVFLCCQCQLTFTTKSYLQKHTEKSHSLDLSPASALSELDDHLSNGNVKPDPMSSSSSVDELAYRCPQCPKSFKQKGHVQRHMRNVHSKVKPYCCIHCRRCFAQLSCLARHQIRVHGKKKKQGIEEFMSEEVRGKSQPSPDRTQETESSTSDAPPTGGSVLFPCPHCPFSSTVESSLCQHMKSHDQREKVIKMQASVEVRGESTHKPESPEVPSDALHTEPQTDEPAQTGEEANSCSQCGKSFKQKGHFQRHMRAVHSNVRPYCCPQCRKCFAQGYDLARHQLRVHGTKKKRRVVEVRGENLPRPPSDSAWEPEPPSTNDSPTETQTGRAPSQRLRNLRVKSTRTSKAKTKANAPKQRQISTKKRSHSDPDSDALDMDEEMEGDAVGEAQYSCTECQGTYDNPESLKSHQCIQVVVGPPPYSCPTCGVTFKRYTTLKKHKLNKHPKENMRYCCTRCGRFFSQAAGLQRHLEAEVCKDIQLSSKEAVPCSYCQFSFTEERYLRKHVKRHHPDEHVSQATGLGSGIIQSEQKAGEAGEVHLCLQCGKSYEHVQRFKAHRCFQSDAAKLHLCNDCGKGFSCFYSLKQHQRIHTGEKPYRCSYCEKCFSHSGHLNVHVRIHTGEKSFLCTECGESFRQSGDLKRHERKHTGVKPCTCPECGKSFSRPQSLKAHLMLHNGERQYKCDQCGKSFSRNYHLTRHHEKTHS